MKWNIALSIHTERCKTNHRHMQWRNVFLFWFVLWAFTARLLENRAVLRTCDQKSARRQTPKLTAVSLSLVHSCMLEHRVRWQMGDILVEGEENGELFIFGPKGWDAQVYYICCHLCLEHAERKLEIFHLKQHEWMNVYVFMACPFIFPLSAHWGWSKNLFFWYCMVFGS